MKLWFLAAFTFFAALSVCARDARSEIAENPQRAGGVYYAYPENEISPLYGSPAPQGYTPFYMSHYGRHGSRYLISDDDYTRIANTLQQAKDAGALSTRGTLLLEQLDTILAETRGRGGELTPLGTRQHRGIARRAAAAYPEIFADSAVITAASTPVMRCAHSMFAFMEGIKEFNPKLDISRESSPRNLYYLNYHSPQSGPYAGSKGPWKQDSKRFRNKVIDPQRLTKELFADSTYAATWVDSEQLMWDIYWLAADMQNTETHIDLLPLFTQDELYNLWQVHNFDFYATNSSYPRANGKHIANARNLVVHIVENADSAIATGTHGATLRFGHDGNIIPLVTLMRIEGCYSDIVEPERLADEYAIYRISPMAANLQMIFFRNDTNPDDVLVRIYLNEKDAVVPVQSIVVNGAPYYPWPALRSYLTTL